VVQPVAATWRQRLGTLAVCAAFAVLHTWPLARDVSGWSRLDNADTVLNTWAVDWVARTLPRDPRQVFDAPIFHPEPRALAYSEHLLAQGALAMPLRVAGLSPVATFNLLVMAGLALSAWAMWQLVASWTGDPWAGAVAGLAFAFNAHTLTRFGQIQGLHLEFVPVVLHAIDGLATRGRIRDAAWLAAGLALVGLTSIYLLVFTAAGAAAGLAGRLAEWRGRAARTAALALAGAIGAAVLLAPVLAPYRALNREAGLARTLDDAARYRATWHDYLATGSRLHASWSAPHHTSDTSLFPGIGVVVLAAMAVAGPGRQTGRVRMLAALAAAGVLLSLGPAVPGYASLHDLLSPFRAIRVVARWGVLWLIAVAGLAGLGMAAARARLRAGRAVAVGIAAVVVVTVEALRAPMAYTPTPRLPAVYARVAAASGAVLVEYPIFHSARFHLNAPYLLAQTAHGQRIVSGYSGFAPRGYDARVDDLNTLPSARAHAQLRALGATHVLLHVGELGAVLTPDLRQRIDTTPWLRLDYDDGAARLYAVAP
jgi:hypothetical protein